MTPIYAFDSQLYLVNRAYSSAFANGSVTYVLSSLGIGNELVLYFFIPGDFRTLLLLTEVKIETQ